jgi:hypothetical protein
MPRWFGSKSEVSETCQLKPVAASSVWCEEGSWPAVLLLCINALASMVYDAGARSEKRGPRCNGRVGRGGCLGGRKQQNVKRRNFSPRFFPLHHWCQDMDIDTEGTIAIIHRLSTVTTVENNPPPSSSLLSGNMVAGKNSPQALAKAASNPRLPPLPRLRVRRPNQGEANPCIGLLSSVLGCWASQGYTAQGCAALEQQLRVCMDAKVSLGQ